MEALNLMKNILFLKGIKKFSQGLLKVLFQSRYFAEW